MENPAHELLAAWESYYVIVVGFAAALTGLQFVVMALVADTSAQRSEESVAAFGTPTVVHFCLSLFVAALISAPWQSLSPVSWLLLAGGVAGLAYTVIVIRRARKQTSYEPVAEDWLWHVILPFAAYGILIGGGAFLRRDPVTALFVVAAVALLLLFIGIHNAWDTVSWLALRRGPKSDE